MEKSEARVAHDALLLLHRYGQGLWWHGLTRKMIVSGTLKQLVDKEGLLGIATDFTDWGRGLEGVEYNEDLAALKRAQKKANEIREALLIKDARMAADILREVYESSQAVDGYVCVDLSPYAMESGDEAIAEGTRIFSAIGRKNVMVKLPATTAGIVAFENLIAKGVNAAVCGLMTPESYRQVAGAYMSGLEKVVRRGGDPATISAVAEFPIAEIDKQANEFLQDELVPAVNDACRQLHQDCVGRTAIATAYATYSIYHELFGGKRSQQWKLLAAKGARPQRLLFSQTGGSGLSENGKRYIESLIGADTIIALSQGEIDGFGEQLMVQPALERKSAELLAMRERLKEQGLTLGEHLARFQERQVDQYIAGLDTLLGIIEKRLAELK